MSQRESTVAYIVLWLTITNIMECIGLLVKMIKLIPHYSKNHSAEFKIYMTILACLYLHNERSLTRGIAIYFEITKIEF